MCGRFTLFSLDQLAIAFPDVELPEGLVPRFNIAPTLPVLAILNRDPGRFSWVHWGLIPSWSMDRSIGGRMINARMETIADKPSFRTAYRRRRCVVPADGFFEWRKEPDGKTKTPIYIRRKDRKTLGFAGLWETWQDPNGTELRSCTLITGEPNQLIAQIHDRMVVMLPAELRRDWLNPDPLEPAELHRMLVSIPAEDLETFAVGRQVNSPRNDTPALIEPAAAGGLFDS